MNRFVSRPAWSLASRITSNHLTPIRHKSNNTSNSSGGKFLGKALGGLIFSGVVAGGGIIGYASYDSEFREIFQENVPLSKEILDAIIGDENSIPLSIKLDPNIAVPPSKMKLQIIADPPMPDIEEPPSKKEENSAINETPIEKDPVDPEIKKEELTIENVESNMLVAGKQIKRRAFQSSSAQATSLSRESKNLRLKKKSKPNIVMIL